MIALRILRATHDEHRKGIFDSFLFMVEDEDFEKPHQATPGQLMQRGFHVRPGDVDYIASLIARDMETANVNMQRVYRREAKQVVDVFVEGERGEHIYQITSEDIAAALAGRDVDLPAWIIERIKAKYGGAGKGAA